ncbi:MAG: hypothetical protein LUC44_01100 [Prevotellaceae bacterium]|nr:hypothetical protein [Prevotellaceae bacterium]
MKKTILAIVAAAFLGACASHKQASRQALVSQDTITYAYNQTQGLTQKDVQFFNRVCESYGGLQYTPIWVSISNDDETLYSYFCKGQNGKNVVVVIEKPSHGKPVIKEIKQMSKPRKPINVLTAFYDSRVGSGPLEAVLASQGCEVIGRDDNLCSVTLRARNSETRTLLENTKGVISVTEHQIMPPRGSN